jgi:hypothetical protein
MVPVKAEASSKAQCYFIARIYNHFEWSKSIKRVTHCTAQKAQYRTNVTKKSSKRNEPNSGAGAKSTQPPQSEGEQWFAVLKHRPGSGA